MPDRAAALGSLTAFLNGLVADAGTRPRAFVVISGHWEEPVPTVVARSDYAMLYDYYGFPEHTYRIQYPAPGSLEVAAQVEGLLVDAGFHPGTEHVRGYDHGVFVPFSLIEPDAAIPLVPVSLIDGLDPAQHLALGAALRPLRDDNVLIVGSGMSFHNLRALYGGGDVLARSKRFDDWLTAAVTGDPAERDELLEHWTSAPEARFAHPREEHLLPLMVAAGAAEGDRAIRDYNDTLMGAVTSGFRFG
jgi:aromatic ring-opening dioxygenase catalytic subunit (LigB family)